MNQATMTKIGELILAARVERNLTQAELADLLGVTEEAVALAEAGTVSLSPDKLALAVKRLGVNLQGIVRGRSG